MNFNEKYRAKSLNDICGQEYNISKLKGLVDNIHNRIDDGDCPHIFLTGPAGTGKTASAIAFLKDCFGNDWDLNFKEFNASETRIKEIRDIVIDLAGNAVLGTYQAPNEKIYDIPFNTIFFDEIDYLPPTSQAILRRVMEKYAVNTRFILSCNYPFKVIEALKSRCMQLHFGRLRQDAIMQILTPIIQKEHIDIDNDAFMLLSENCKGDARRAQNILYKASLTGKIDVAEIERATLEIMTRFNTKLLGMAITANNNDDETYIKDFKMLESHIDQLYYDKGFSGSQILINIFDSVQDDEKMPIPIKRKILSSIGECMRNCSLVDDDIYAVKMWLRSVK